MDRLLRVLVLIAACMVQATCTARIAPVGSTVATVASVPGVPGVPGVATIATDKDDYPPGHLVTFTGHGWAPGEKVTIVLKRTPRVHDDEVLTSVADASGTVTNTDFRPAQYDLGVRFAVTATGATSGRQADWTFTDAALTWTGAVSTEWNLAGNWSSGTIPTSGDSISIPANVASGRYPVVSTASAIATTITLEAGAGTPPTLTVSAQTLTVSGNLKIDNGTVTLSGGTMLNTAGTATITGTLEVTGGTYLSSVTLAVASGGNVNLSGTGTIHMASALSTEPTDKITIAVGGTFTQSGGTVNLKDFTVSAGSPGGIYNQSGGTFVIYHDFRNSGTFDATGGSIVFAGDGGRSAFNAPGTNQFFNVVVNSGVTTDFASSLAASILVRGDWTNNGAVTMVSEATTVTFNGTGAQTIGGSTATTFRNVVVDKASGAVTLAVNSAITNGDLTVTSGTLDLASYAMNRSSSGGVLTLSNGTFLRIGGTGTFPANFATETLGATSTVEYYGTDQTVAAESYGHLTLSGSGTKTMPGTAMTIAGNFTMDGTASATAAQALTVNGNVSLASGTTFNAGAFGHGFKGNFTNNGTFTASTSTITFNGTSAQTIGGSSATTFNSVTLNNSSGVTLNGVSATVDGTLTFTSGRWTTGTNTLSLGASGSVSRTSGHVVGYFRKHVATGATSRTYEIGDASNYMPVTVAFASVSVAGNLTVSTSAGDHVNITGATLNSTRSVNRTWTLTNGGVTFTSYSATFTFVAGDLDAGTATGSLIGGRHASGSWTYPTVGTRTATTTQLTGITGDGDFQLAEVTYKLAGTVFEDVNYGGGAGRNRATSSGVVRSGARVELYTSGGVYSAFTTTDANGDYIFHDITVGTWYVRVVTGSVTSSRTGYTASALPVQTYRTDASAGSASAVTNAVGGTDPAAAGAGAASSGATFNTSTFVYSAVLSGTAQSVTTAAVSSANITGLDFGFSFDVVVNTNNAGAGSLRQFITNANLLGGDASLAQSGLTAGAENAVFMIPNGTSAAGLRAAFNYFSGGVATITPTSALPAISTPMVLDAQKQPGWSSAPIMQLSGGSAGSGAKGLEITAGSTTVRGFVINGFTGSASSAGIWLSTAGSNTIQGNYIGTNAAGTSASANYQGVYIASSGNTIGGGTAAQRNVLSGNTWRGILVDNAGGSAGSNTIQGNYIGMNAAGTAAVANNIGIYLSDSPDNVIGGTGANEGNVASGNTNFGIYLVSSGTTGTLIRGNTVGLNAARSAAVPNGSTGIEICCGGGGGSNNTIGGTSAAAANVISGNTGRGVRILNGTGNAVLGNAIYGNGGIGIDLGSDDVTANDGATNGSVANSGMDHPVFTSVLLNGTSLAVTGYVGSAAGQSTFAGARVELYKSDTDASGFGEGQVYLGYATADASGNISATLTVAGLSVGDKLTGTATDGSNNTSEFGANAEVVAPVPLMLLAASVSPSGTQVPGTEVAFTSTFTNAGTAAAANVVITDPIPANTDFKVGSATQSLGTTGLSATIEYSSNGGTTWTYTPSSGAGGAPAGFDRLVTNIRWTFTGNLSMTAPNNAGSVTFTLRIR